MTDVVQPFAFIFEIAQPGEGVFTASKELRQGGDRVSLTLIAYSFVVNDHTKSIKKSAKNQHEFHGKV